MSWLPQSIHLGGDVGLAEDVTKGIEVLRCVVEAIVAGGASGARHGVKPDEAVDLGVAVEVLTEAGDPLGLVGAVCAGLRDDDVLAVGDGLQRLQGRIEGLGGG
jgi:hypothetical protein